MRVLYLEVTDNLTAETPILAFSQFIARPGYVKIVTSCNRSNFMDGDSELRALVIKLNNKRVTQHLNFKNISWNFNLSLLSLLLVDS